MKKYVVFAVVALSLLVVISGCAGSSVPVDSSPTPHASSDSTPLYYALGVNCLLHEEGKNADSAQSELDFASSLAVTAVPAAPEGMSSGKRLH